MASASRSMSDDLVGGLIELQAQEIARLRLELSDMKTANENRKTTVEQNDSTEVLAKQLQSLADVVVRSEPRARDIDLGTLPDEVVRDSQQALEALHEERNKLKVNVEALTAELAAVRDELAQCRSELEATCDREQDLLRAFTEVAHLREVASAPSPSALVESRTTVETPSDEERCSVNKNWAVGVDWAGHKYSLAGLKYPEGQPDPSFRVRTDQLNGEVSAPVKEKGKAVAPSTSKSAQGPAKIIRATFKSFGKKSGFLREGKIRAVSKGRNVHTSNGFDLVWKECPDRAFIAKAGQRLAEDGIWRPRPIKDIQNLQEQMEVELVVQVRGSSYYVGTFVCGEQEELGLEDFKALPSAIQDAIVNKSCNNRRKHVDSFRQEVRQMYENRVVSAIKIPLQRVGYDAVYQERLLEIPA